MVSDIPFGEGKIVNLFLQWHLRCCPRFSESVSKFMEASKHFEVSKAVRACAEKYSSRNPSLSNNLPIQQFIKLTVQIVMTVPSSVHRNVVDGLPPAFLPRKQGRNFQGQHTLISSALVHN